MNKKQQVWAYLQQRKSVSANWLSKKVPIDPDGLRGRISDLRKEYGDSYRILFCKGVYILEVKRKSKTLWEKFISLFK